MGRWKVTDNETISAWRGYSRDPYCLTKKFDALTMYDSDPAAWDKELYALIKERGLKDAFVALLSVIVHANSVPHPFDAYWLIISATPKQKAHALARAIEEK